MTSKIYQLVHHKDGSRTPPLSTPSLADLAGKLRDAVAVNPDRGEDFVLVLIESADDQPFASRAPLIKVSTLVALHNPEKV